MHVSQLFLQRYDALHNFWLADVWTSVPDDIMRRRPHPRVNSIAWILWHVTRAEDAGLNRFVADRPQVLDGGDWMRRMNVPWRHHGGGMSPAEADDLSRRVDLRALRDYSSAVQLRTREVVDRLDEIDLDAVMTTERLRPILVDEGLAHSNVEEQLENYAGWTRGKCLMNLCLTHSFQHVGQIGVIATLHGVEFE
jgi:uncharacterized damage-inducible protein DinB